MPPLPTHPQVHLDLSNCSGCLPLSGDTAQVIIANLRLTGMTTASASQRSGGSGSGSGSSSGSNNNYNSSNSSSSSSGSDGYNLVLPLWVFQFNRSGAAPPRVSLYNVTLVLPQADFIGLLAALGVLNPVMGGPPYVDVLPVSSLWLVDWLVGW